MNTLCTAPPEVMHSPGRRAHPRPRAISGPPSRVMHSPYYGVSSLLLLLKEQNGRTSQATTAPPPFSLAAGSAARERATRDPANDTTTAPAYTLLVQRDHHGPETPHPMPEPTTAERLRALIDHDVAAAGDVLAQLGELPTTDEAVRVAALAYAATVLERADDDDGTLMEGERTAAIDALNVLEGKLDAAADAADAINGAVIRLREAMVHTRAEHYDGTALEPLREALRRVSATDPAGVARDIDEAHAAVFELRRRLEECDA